MYLEIYTLCSTERCFAKLFQYQALTLTDFWQTLFVFVYQTEVGTECDHITMNFVCHDGNSLNVFVQKGV